MRLGIFCNFGPPHCGGSEEVIKHISRGFAYRYDVTIYSHSQNNPYRDDNGVMNARSERGNALIFQINENDHILVYSDSFWGWDTIVENIDKVVPDVSVALVGAYHMRSRGKRARELFRQNIDRFRIICHSEGDDYRWAIQNRWKVHIIPNGVDLEEFRSNVIDFREKYKIKEKYIILNVSNWFYGKGQDLLASIGERLNSDCVIVQISNSVEYPYDKTFLKRCKNKCKNINVRFLRDIPREDVVAAFKSADVFVFTSQKEVCPLVILESQAAGLPWVSMNVGDIRNRKGGAIISHYNEDSKGYKIIDEKVSVYYVLEIANVLQNIDFRKKLIMEGQKDIEQLDWKNIVPLYDKVFNL